MTEVAIVAQNEVAHLHPIKKIAINEVPVRYRGGGGVKRNHKDAVECEFRQQFEPLFDGGQDRRGLQRMRDNHRMRVKGNEPRGLLRPGIAARYQLLDDRTVAPGATPSNTPSVTAVFASGSLDNSSRLLTTVIGDLDNGVLLAGRPAFPGSTKSRVRIDDAQSVVIVIAVALPEREQRAGMVQHTHRPGRHLADHVHRILQPRQFADAEGAFRSFR